jgi:hypothetical protein
MAKLKDRKKFIFYALMVILPYLLLALLELALRLFSFGDNLDLFISSSDSKYYAINPLVGKRFFSKNQYAIPVISEIFLKEKPANGYRIFVLGESSVQSFPYDANLAFTRILQRRLQNIFPYRTIEVVNLGMTAINSYTLLDFTDELLQQKPDLVLIYTGHNEYYGALGVASTENGSIPRWFKKLHLKIVHIRTYQLLQKGIENISKLIHEKTERDANATMMEKMIDKNVIPYNSKMYSEGLTQFSDNMSILLGKLKKAQVPVIISDLVSNIRNLSPFRSLQYDVYPRADSLFSDAKRLDTGHVYDKAKEEYIRAKDFDVIRFRASEDINKIIVNLADSLGLYRISLKSLFEEYSPQSIVGSNLMIDHLHPNIDGYFLMAEGFLQALRDHGMIEHYWDSTRVKSSTYYRHTWGFTELDSMIADIRIKHLKAGWPFQPETTINNFRSTYIPNGIIDSLAFARVEYDISLSVVHEKLAAYYESIGDLKHASKEYLSVAYYSPSDVSSYYYAADFAYKAKEYTDAIRYLQESPNVDTSSYAQFTLASIYYSQKNYKEALTCIDRLQKLRSNKINYLQVQKLKYNVLKDSDLSSDAEKTLADIKITDPTFNESGGGKSDVILIPNTIKPYLEKAETLRKNGQLSEAVSVLKEANTIRELSSTNLLIGELLFLENNNNEALRYLEKAHREIKDNPTLIYSLCVLYTIKRDLPKAKEAMDDFTGLVGKNHPQSKLLRSLFEKTVAGGKRSR